MHSTVTFSFYYPELEKTIIYAIYEFHYKNNSPYTILKRALIINRNENQQSVYASAGPIKNKTCPTYVFIGMFNLT